MRGRFAPSPTGQLHLGNARTALLAWLQARSTQDSFLLRIEDLDPSRRRQSNIDSLFYDLEYLGLDWDESPIYQSERGEAYREALSRLSAEGRIYPCHCSRTEILRAAQAPHGPGDEGARYPGTCASGLPSSAGRGERPAAQRFRTAPGLWRFEDLVHGSYAQDVQQVVGDFVIQRGDGVASYQLAVVVDDALSGVTHVLRGADLLGSTPRQLQLYRALGLPPPTYAHVPLVVTPDGKRLAKREGALALSELRRQKVPKERVVALLAEWIGLEAPEGALPRDLVGSFSLQCLSREPWVVTEEEVRKRLKLR